MAGRAVSLMNSCCRNEYPGKITTYVLFTCLVASTGGIVFGYDIGIFSGVSSMDSFLVKFFPSGYRLQRENGGTRNQYCKPSDGQLTLFKSSLHLAALVASFFASSVTRKFGRRLSMFSGGLIFFLGASLQSAAANILMLILGRILLGIGVGFVIQSVPIYLSEMSPARLRGMLNIGFQLNITIGILAANLINYWTARIEGGWGWRLSLALAGVPGAIMAIGALALPDTPNSLIERGHEQAAREILCKVRGTEEIEEEFQDLVKASNDSRAVKHPWKNVLERRYRPQFTMAALIPFFQQLTGINVIMFYSPVLFKTVGFGDQAALMSSVITGVVNMLATSISIVSVDKVGRRALFLTGGFQMLICQIIVGALIGVKYGISGTETELTRNYAALVVSFICLYVSAYAWSWGPMGWLVPSEIFPLEVRSAGQSINVSVNMFITFLSSQVFYNMLCNLKFGLFFFYAGWVIIMTSFIWRFLPETKNVPVEQMEIVWKNHWHWGKFFHDNPLPPKKWASFA